MRNPSRPPARRAARLVRVDSLTRAESPHRGRCGCGRRVVVGRFFAGFYNRLPVFDSVGSRRCVLDLLRSKLLLFFMFGGTFVAIAILNLVIADRLAPSAFSANTIPGGAVPRIFGHRLRSLRIAVATVAGLLFDAPAVGHWQDG